MANRGFNDQLVQALNEVCSVRYEEAFEKVHQPNVESLTEQEEMVLYSYPNQITWYAGDKKNEMIDRFRRTHMEWFIQWLKINHTGKPPYQKWNELLTRAMLHLDNLFFRIDLGNIVTDEDIRDGFRRISDVIKDILMKLSESNPEKFETSVLPLARELLLILFYFTVDNDLAIYLKSLHLVDLMNDFIRKSDNDDEICLQAYRTLAVVLAEADIKQLQNSNRIASIFLNYIDSSIKNGSVSAGRLQNTLRSLKILTQHDQIREELIKQNGENLFLRCVYGTQFDLIKTKLPALQILLALSLNENFCNHLKQNHEFLDHVRSLTSSTDSEIQKVSTGLIWILEKESREPSVELNNTTRNEILAPPPPSQKYDIMISYSHSDKILCHQINTELIKDSFKVWIDSQLMHGATFDAMAHAIENCEFVIICMSDAYKQSVFCEMEANYAIKRRRRIIPLVVTSQYKADGWLGILTAAYIYVDFPKLGFQKAYDELKKQINLLRKSNISVPDTKKEQIHLTVVHQIPEETVERKQREPRPATEYPPCLLNWSEEHVKSFLLHKELDALLPVLETMNGQLVYQVYTMCQANQQGMFLSCKEDVARSQLGPLTLKDYLVFLNEIKIYVPISTHQSTNQSSALCHIM